MRTCCGQGRLTAQLVDMPVLVRQQLLEQRILLMLLARVLTEALAVPLVVLLLVMALVAVPRAVAVELLALDSLGLLLTLVVSTASVRSEISWRQPLPWAAQVPFR